MVNQVEQDNLAMVGYLQVPWVTTPLSGGPFTDNMVTSNLLIIVRRTIQSTVNEQ